MRNTKLLSSYEGNIEGVEIDVELHSRDGRYFAFEDEVIIKLNHLDEDAEFIAKDQMLKSHSISLSLGRLDARMLAWL